MPYVALKHLHLTCVAISGFGFFARGLLMLLDSSLLAKRWVKIVPHIVDTLLLATALGLMWLGGLSPFVAPWLTAKLVGLVVYIVLGAFALKYAPTKQLRGICFVLALFIFAWIVSVALLKTPAGFLSWI